MSNKTTEYGEGYYAAPSTEFDPGAMLSLNIDRVRVTYNGSALYDNVKVVSLISLLDDGLVVLERNGLQCVSHRRTFPFI